MKSFELKGLENFLKKCENLENEQKQIILKEIIAETLYKESKENLEKEQDSNGKKWAPLKQSTLKSRKAQRSCILKSFLQQALCKALYIVEWKMIELL